MCEKIWRLSAKRKKWVKEWWKDYKRPPESKKMKEYRIKKRRREIDDLEEPYIRRLMARYSTLTESEIPAELIEAKRNQIILKREKRRIENDYQDKGI